MQLVIQRLQVRVIAQEIFPTTPVECLPFLTPPPTETQHTSSVVPQHGLAVHCGGISGNTSSNMGSNDGNPSLPVAKRHLSMMPRQTSKATYSLRVQAIASPLGICCHILG